MSEPNGHSGIHLLGGNGSAKKARDAKGRVLTHNATVADATDIAIDVSEHYMQQVPGLVQAVLHAYGIRPPMVPPEGSLPSVLAGEATRSESPPAPDPSTLTDGDAPADVLADAQGNEAPGASQEDLPS